MDDLTAQGDDLTRGALHHHLQGIITPADARALASLIYGSLAEAAFWIAEGEDGAVRMEQAAVGLDLLLRGLLQPPTRY